MQYEDHLRPSRSSSPESQIQAASHLHRGVSGASISCALKCTSFEGALCKISQGLLANACLLPVNISAYVDDCCENSLGEQKPCCTFHARCWRLASSSNKQRQRTNGYLRLNAAPKEPLLSALGERGGCILCKHDDRILHTAVNSFLHRECFSE